MQQFVEYSDYASCTVTVALNVQIKIRCRTAVDALTCTGQNQNRIQYIAVALQSLKMQFFSSLLCNQAFIGVHIGVNKCRFKANVAINTVMLSSADWAAAKGPTSCCEEGIFQRLLCCCPLADIRMQKMHLLQKQAANFGIHLAWYSILQAVQHWMGYSGHWIWNSIGCCLHNQILG